MKQLTKRDRQAELVKFRFYKAGRSDSNAEDMRRGTCDRNQRALAQALNARRCLSLAETWPDRLHIEICLCRLPLLRLRPVSRTIGRL